MNKASIIQNEHHAGFQRLPQPPLLWLGSHRLRLLRMRDRIVPWQMRHFYYHHEVKARAGALLGIALLLGHMFALTVQAIANIFGPAILHPVILHIEALFVSGLQSLARRIRVARGTLLYQQAQPANDLMILAEGYGRLCIEHEDGRRLTVGLVSPGDLFGEETLLDEPERESSFEAILNSQVDIVSYDDFTAFVNKHPDMLRSVTAHLAQRLLA
jgi:CRP-like cAMP-binding protein